PEPRGRLSRLGPRLGAGPGLGRRRVLVAPPRRGPDRRALRRGSRPARRRPARDPALLALPGDPAGAPRRAALGPPARRGGGADQVGGPIGRLMWQGVAGNRGGLVPAGRPLHRVPRPEAPPALRRPLGRRGEGLTGAGGFPNFPAGRKARDPELTASS